MNRVIRQASIIGLCMLAVTLGVKAQSAQQYRAEVPFDFVAAGKHYEAGKYSVGPLSQIASPGGIVIRDVRNGNARLLGVNSAQGDSSWDKPGTLTFLKVNGIYRLSQISTATFKMNMKSKKQRSSDLARVTSSNPEAVAIALHK